MVFVSFGALFGSFGQALREHEETLTRVFGIITILLGLVLAGAFGRVMLFNRDARLHWLPPAGLIGAPLLGVTFALGWTPCIGPTLGRGAGAGGVQRSGVGAAGGGPLRGLLPRAGHPLPRDGPGVRADDDGASPS